MIQSRCDEMQRGWQVGDELRCEWVGWGLGGGRLILILADWLTATG